MQITFQTFTVRMKQTGRIVVARTPQDADRLKQYIADGMAERVDENKMLAVENK